MDKPLLRPLTLNVLVNDSKGTFRPVLVLHADDNFRDALRRSTGTGLLRECRTPDEVPNVELSLPFLGVGVEPEESSEGDRYWHVTVWAIGHLAQTLGAPPGQGLLVSEVHFIRENPDLDWFKYAKIVGGTALVVLPEEAWNYSSSLVEALKRRGGLAGMCQVVFAPE